MNDLVIREVLETDLLEVVKLQVNSWWETYKGIIDDNFLNSMKVLEIVERRKNDYQKTKFIVAILNDEIVGFCRYIDNDNHYYEFSDIDCEIIALYVKKEKSRLGIGKKIFQYVIDDFKNNDKNKMIIWCLKENYNARKFYEKMGGKIKGEHYITFGEKEYLEVGYEFLVNEEN